MVRATRNCYRVFGWSDERARFIAVAASPIVDLERLASGQGAETLSQHAAVS